MYFLVFGGYLKSTYLYLGIFDVSDYPKKVTWTKLNEFFTEDIGHGARAQLYGKYFDKIMITGGSLNLNNIIIYNIPNKECTKYKNILNKECSFHGFEFIEITNEEIENYKDEIYEKRILKKKEKKNNEEEEEEKDEWEIEEEKENQQNKSSNKICKIMIWRDDWCCYYYKNIHYYLIHVIVKYYILVFIYNIFVF